MKTEELTIDFLKVKTQEILKSLPISHYLKTTIEVVFDENAQTSYFDPQKFNIHLALANVVMAIMGAKKTTINDSDLEKHIRNTLYHEVSHAILTPYNLMEQIQYVRKRIADQKAQDPNYQVNFDLTCDLANIIEDERIETLLKDYYLLVDFKENVYNINNGITNAKTFVEFVFNAVRFRYSPIKQKEINDKVNDFIRRNADINAINNRFMGWEMNDLVLFLKQVWEELTNSQPKQNNTQKQSSQDSSDSEEDTSSTTEDSTEDSSEDPSQSEDKDTTESEEDSSKEEKEDTEKSSEEDTDSDDAEDKEKGDDSSKEESTEDIDLDIEDIERMLESLTEEQVEDLIAKAISEMKKQAQRCGSYQISLDDIQEDKKVLTDMIKIIVKNTGVGNADSPSQYGYCGRFNAKKFMKDHNDSYKWFEKKSFSDETLNKNAQNKVLNIFLDNSGSFWQYDDAVNKVLKALYEVEKRYTTFKFNLICWGNGYVAEKGTQRISKAQFRDWGTTLKGFRQVYKQYNPSGKEYNILLTDGSINCIQEIDACNNNHSIIISESTNRKNIKVLCPNAKALIFENEYYADRLAENIIRALDLLF